MKTPARNLLLLGAIFATTHLAWGAETSILVPSSSQNVGGYFGEYFTLGPSSRLQAVYGASLLNQLQVGDQITGISFSPNGTQPSVPPQTVADYSITLSTAKNGPGQLSENFRDNIGFDATTVRHGPLVVGQDDYPGFGKVIEFTTPFTYKGGPLLVDIAHSGFTSGAFVGGAFGIDAEILWGSAESETSNLGWANSMGVVLNLKVQTVPEPSTYLLLAFGIGALAWIRRRSVGP